MFLEFISSPIILSVLFSVITAQVLKAVFDFWKDKNFHWQSLFRGAGMPSSHTATVVALALSVALVEGMTNLFFVTLVVAIIVVRDVIGDKIFAVHQENILNKIIQQIVRQEKVEWTHLIGHTLTEVFAGFVLGIGVTLLTFLYF